MMANDVGLHLPTPPRAIVSLSGIPLVVEHWTAKARQKAFQGLKVFVSHGRADQLLPFQASVWLHGMHKNNGLDSTHHAHSGGHDLGGPTDLLALAEYLRKAVGDDPATQPAAKAPPVAASSAASAGGESEGGGSGGGGGGGGAAAAAPAPAGGVGAAAGGVGAAAPAPASAPVPAPATGSNAGATADAAPALPDAGDSSS
jgi:hypothetical protein